MRDKVKILVINPGSTSTKIAVFENENKIFQTNIAHEPEELKKYKEIYHQLDFRKKAILDMLNMNNIKLSDMCAVVSRCGGLNYCEGGTYIVNEKTLEDCKIGIVGKHAASLGPIIANDFANEIGVKAYFVDPTTVDEMQPVARITGLPWISRKSKFHALNQKAVARRLAKELNKRYDEVNVVIAHLGGGISVAAHQKGRVVDVTDSYCGDGPFSPNRCGALPADEIVDMCFSGKYEKKDIMDLLTKNGGLLQHLGTSEVREVVQRIANGDEKAALVYNAMIYQTAKAIGSYAAALGGKVDAVGLTGGIVNDKVLVAKIIEMVSFIAPVKVYPGEFEMEALAEGCLRVLRGEETAKIYKG